MAKEYIERKALLQDIDETVLSSNKTGKRNPEIKGANKVIGRIQAMPTADVQEFRHGKWKYDNIALKCSECDKWLVIEQGTADMNFCPNCGAKMDKE